MGFGGSERKGWMRSADMSPRGEVPGVDGLDGQASSSAPGYIAFNCLPLDVTNSIHETSHVRTTFHSGPASPSHTRRRRLLRQRRARRVHTHHIAERRRHACRGAQPTVRRRATSRHCPRARFGKSHAPGSRGLLRVPPVHRLCLAALRQAWGRTVNGSVCTGGRE